MNIKLQNLHLGYQSTLIEAANAQINPSEIILLYGPNGSGKSSLMRAMLGLEKPLSGQILLDEQPVLEYPKNLLAKQVAVVFAKSSLNPNFTLFDLVSYGKYPHYGIYNDLSAEDLSEVAEIIQTLGLEDYQHQRLDKLSDGNLQKAHIGRALAQNTPFILLDEPTAHLDPANKIALLELLYQLAKKQGKCILFSSHDWHFASQIADMVWWIHQKKLLINDVMHTAVHDEFEFFNIVKKC
jgi:iron complex transport system ATP-binding protein